MADRKKGKAAQQSKRADAEHGLGDGIAQAVLNIVPYIGRSIVVVSFSAPLYVVFRAVEALAGKSTTASFGITASIALAGLGALGKIWSDHRKMSEQSAELKRLRERCDALEAQLLDRRPGAKVT